jgi:hypothetical protein
MSGRRSPRDTSQVAAAPTGGESASLAAAIESSRTAERSSGRKSSRPPSRRRVVSRSEPLRELAPSDRSSETGASAPASAGDTSLLVEQPTVRESVLARLSGAERSTCRPQVAWHAYWDEHGGFGGANLDNEQLMAAHAAHAAS